MIIICWLITFWNYYWKGLNLSGHDFVETHRDEEKQVLTCTRCPHESVGYYHKKELGK